MYWEPISREQLQKIYAKFNATEESLRDDVRRLRQWMATQPHLPAVSDDKFLVSLLLQSKNDFENTKLQVDTYYTARAKMTDYFSGRDPCQIWFQDFMDTLYDVHIPLPKPTSEGQRVFLVRALEFKTSSTLTATTFLKGCQMVVDLLVKEDSNAEVILICDYENALSPRHISLSFRCVKQYINLFSNVLKFRPQKIYILNAHPLIQPVLALVRIVMKKKLTDRMVMWNKKPQDLAQEIPKEVLPVEYGGDLKSITDLKDEYYDYIRGFRDWFLTEENIKADLTKKPSGNSKPSTSDSTGAERSFDKLNFD